LETDWYLRLLLLFFLLLLSGFFSGSEVALFSLDKIKIKNIRNSHPLIGEYINNLLEFPRRLLVTILLGNTTVNVGITIISVTLTIEAATIYSISTEYALIAQVVLITILVLLIGEITPKVWASRYPVTFAKIVSVPLYWIGVIVYPVTKIITDIIKSLVSKIKWDKSKTAILTDEIPELANLGKEKGSIVEEEQELIQGLVSYRTITVREVMTPRVDIVAVSSDTDFDELMKIVTESGHSRIPLYGNNLDEIIGIIYTKDLLIYLKDESKKKNLILSKIARKAMFVPETKLISDLLKEFQEKKMHVGIVVDEYGGTAGLISLEDILEEIVGEIRDEYDEDENEITKLNENSYLVLGKVSIDELNEKLNIDLYNENNDYDTIGGFILNYSGSIPQEGYSFEYENYKFTVKEIENRRVKKVLIESIPQVDISRE